ncbi:MAG: CapA family protein [Chloroflexi bacterium]|nr:CapA family protein [Chloroflexota bacterium]
MVSQESRLLTLAAVGDVSPNRDDPPSVFRYSRHVLREADIVFGQMEVPLSDRGIPMLSTNMPRRLAARNVRALTDEGAGSDVMSFASNHAMDYGREAFCDTLDILERSGIAVVGAGRDIQEARKPAVLSRNGTRIGFLAYLSVVNHGSVAQENAPGCAPLRASTSYQHVHHWPGTPLLTITELFPQDKKLMEEDIKRLRPQVDVLAVSMHSGLVHYRGMLAMYQTEAAHAAIDSGADLVLQHHAHILKGIEVYKSKAIFYSLGNFALEHTLGFEGDQRASGRAGEEFRRQVYRIRAEPGYEKHSFRHDSLKTMIAKVYIADKRIAKVTYLPAYITPDLEPEVVGQGDPRAQQVFAYVKDISESEDLPARFSWDGEEVLVSPPAGSQPGE